MSNALQLVISDLDGTIVETEDYHRRAYNALFEELGLSHRWSRQDYSDRLATVGGAKFHEVMGWLGTPAQEAAATRGRLYARKTELYAQLIVADLESRQLALRPGVQRLFDEIRAADIPIAIATTCVKWAAVDVIRAALGAAFLESLAALCAGDDVERKKPHPDVYLLAAEQCGVPSRNCIVLEDTAHGVSAARAAGMACIATPSELALGDDFSAAHLVAGSLEHPRPVTLATLRGLLA